MNFQVVKKQDEYEGGWDYIVVIVGANDLGQKEKEMEQVIADISSTIGLLQALNMDAQVYCCEVLPRSHWNRPIDLFHLPPNKCAATFNEQLRVELGDHVIGVYDEFCLRGALNRDLFNSDGLHPKTGEGQMHLSDVIVGYIERVRVDLMLKMRVRVVSTKPSTDLPAIPTSRCPANEGKRAVVTGTDAGIKFIDRNSPPPPLDDRTEYPNFIDTATCMTAVRTLPVMGSWSAIVGELAETGMVCSQEVATGEDLPAKKQRTSISNILSLIF